MLGSVVGRPTVEHVEQLVADAVSQGAKVLVGGGKANGTLMPGHGGRRRDAGDGAVSRGDVWSAGVASSASKSADEAMRLANDSEYGLSAAVFTRDIAAGPASRAADRIRDLPHQRPDRAR